MTSITMAADSIGLPRVATWFKKLNAKRIERAQIKRTIRELSALADRELWDMGLTRGDIHSVAHGTSDLRRVRENANLKGWV